MGARPTSCSAGLPAPNLPRTSARHPVAAALPIGLAANLWAQMAPKVTRSIGVSWLLDSRLRAARRGGMGPPAPLRPADRVDDDRARRAGSVSPVMSVYPLLHLNLGDVYRRLGDLGLARIHLELGQADVAPWATTATPRQ